MNPFFEGKQWYDYNLGTVRQFREWLQRQRPLCRGPAGRPPTNNATEPGRDERLERQEVQELG